MYFTPILSRLLSKHLPHLVVVNSERFQWIRSDEKAGYKPDSFLCRNGCYETRTPKNDPYEMIRKSLIDKYHYEYHFGRPYYKLLDSVIVFEAKLKVTDAEIGKLIKYLQVDRVDMGLVYDGNNFFFLKLSGQPNVKEPKIAIRGNWSMKGLADALSPFLGLMCYEDELLNLTIKARNLTLISFLGAGSYGRVFRVSREGQEFALKVSSRKDDTRLEFDKHDEILRGATPAPVVKIVPNSFEENDYGCSFLLQSIGKPIKVRKLEGEKKKTRVSVLRNVLKALKKLHDYGICHGDARLENIVKVNEEYLWIDMLLSLEVSKDAILDDIRSLVHSILSLPKNSELPAVIEQILTSEQPPSILNLLKFHLTIGNILFTQNKVICVGESQ